jgi:hypothetical protein
MVKTLLNNEIQPLFSTEKASQYTSQCDQGNITFEVYIMRISLFEGDRRFSENQQRKDHCCKRTDFVVDFTRLH